MNPGDKLLCVNSDSSLSRHKYAKLKQGKIYTFKEIDKTNRPDVEYKLEEVKEGCWFCWRFKNITNGNEKQIEFARVLYENEIL